MADGPSQLSAKKWLNHTRLWRASQGRLCVVVGKAAARHRRTHEPRRRVERASPPVRSTYGFPSRGI